MIKSQQFSISPSYPTLRELRVLTWKWKGLSKWDKLSIYLRSIRIAIQSTLIQAETQSLVLRRKRQWVFVRSRSEMVTSVERRHFYWCRQCNIVMLILNNIFNFQSSSHNNCFLVIFANSSLRHNVPFLGPAQKLLCPMLTFQRSET